MKEKQSVVVGGLVVLLLVVWLGFVVHPSPRFAGSLAGGVLAVSGSALMLVPLAYLLIKRIPPLRRRVTARVPMPTLLAWHIYAGVLGPILVVLHTGHKFESHLGIALTAMTLIVVLSGFAGRYLLGHIGAEIAEKRAMLERLRAAYDATVREVQRDPARAARLRSWRGFFRRFAARAFVLSAPPEGGASEEPTLRALRLAESVAAVEYAIRAHETFKRAFGLWLKLHIVLSVTLYALLALHVWAAIHFGLRWFS